MIYNSDTTISFPQVQPPDNGSPVLLVYDRHNYTASSPFYYWITNRIVNNQVEDWHWNTKQKKDESDWVDVDNFSPKVIKTLPLNGAGDVPLKQHIYVKFSEPMNRNVNLWDAINISPGVSGDWEWISDREIDFTPAPSFYTVSLSLKLKDLADKKLIPNSFSFTTGTSPGPQCYKTRFQWKYLV